MSATIAPRLIGQPNTGGAPTTAADQIIASARDIPDLIAMASAIDPDLAAKFTGKALFASRSPWGTLASGGVAWFVSRYGLGWDQATCDLVAGAGVLLGGFAMRSITDHPITGWFKANTRGTSASEIAKGYGGGGHRNAAGFIRPIGWEGDQP